MKRLREASIRCIPDISLEYQRTANRYVLRGRESGGAVNELWHYVGFYGAEGELLAGFLKPDSLTVSFDHAIVLAPVIASIEMFRYEHIYRDAKQYENEERNAARFHDQSTTAMFRGQRNIHVRVKPPSPSDLMHLKARSDGREVLRARRACRNCTLASVQV